MVLRIGFLEAPVRLAVEGDGPGGARLRYVVEAEGVEVVQRDAGVATIELRGVQVVHAEPAVGCVGGCDRVYQAALAPGAGAAWTCSRCGATGADRPPGEG